MAIKDINSLLEIEKEEIDSLENYEESIQHLADKLNKLSILAVQSGLNTTINNSGEVIAGGLSAKTIGFFEIKWYDANNNGYTDNSEWDNSERLLELTGSKIYQDNSLNILAGDSLDQQMEYYYKTFCTGEYVYQLAVKMTMCNEDGVELSNDKQIPAISGDFNNAAKIISIVKYSNKNGGIYSITAQFGRMFFIFNYNAENGAGTGTLTNSYYYNLDGYVRNSLTGKYQEPKGCICGVSGCTCKGKGAKEHINGYGKPISGRINYALYQLAGKADCFSYGHNSSWIDFWWLVFSGLDKTSPIIRKYEIVNYKVQSQASDRKQHTLFGTIREISKQFRKWLKSLGFKGHGLKFAFNGFVNWIKGFREGGRS